MVGYMVSQPRRPQLKPSLPQKLLSHMVLDYFKELFWKLAERNEENCKKLESG
jgi:hypothetical protein